MVNQGVDGYIKTPHRRKILEKRKKQPTENQKYVKTEYKLSGGPVFTFSLPGGAILPSGLPSVTPGVGKLFRTADQFQPGIILQTGPQ